MDVKKWIVTSRNQVWQGKKYSDLSPVANRLEVLSREQSVEGFGGCFNELGWYHLMTLPQDKREQIMKELFSEQYCRFNFCRLPIGANDYSMEWYDYSPVEEDYDMIHFSIERDMSYILPYVKKALEINPDIRFFASPWSPPVWMKFPKAYNHGRLRQEEDVLKAYALYFVRYIEAYAKEGIKIDQLHIQNEPMSDQKFPSCRWTGKEFRDFIVNYLRPAFDQHKIDTEIWLGTLNGPETDDRALDTRYDDYANLVLSDKEACKYVKGVSYQWAGKYAISQTNDSWPDIRLIQSESECGDGKNTWEYARYIFELTNHYFRHGIGAYVYWNMVLQPEGTSTWGWTQNSMITINADLNTYHKNYEYYVMKHYSHFVDRGARRLKIKGPMTANATLFYNPNGSYILVLYNPFDEERSVSVQILDKTFTFNLDRDSFHSIVIG